MKQHRVFDAPNGENRAIYWTGLVIVAVFLSAFSSHAQQRRLMPRDEVNWSQFSAARPLPMQGGGESVTVRDELSGQCHAFIQVNGVSGVIPNVPCQ